MNRVYRKMPGFYGSPVNETSYSYEFDFRFYDYDYPQTNVSTNNNSGYMTVYCIIF